LKKYFFVDDILIFFEDKGTTHSGVEKDITEVKRILIEGVFKQV
jgi:hypothetical protein